MSSFGDEPAVGRVRVDGEFVPDFAFPLSRKPTALTAAYEKFFSGGATDFGEQDSQNFNCPTTSSHRPY